jgi:hypothetical protein
MIYLHVDKPLHDVYISSTELAAVHRAPDCMRAIPERMSKFGEGDSASHQKGSKLRYEMKLSLSGLFMWYQ